MSASHGEGQTLGSIGNVYSQQGRWDDALVAYRQALSIFQDLGDRYGEVVKVEPARVRVRLDKSGKAFWFRREDVLHPGNRNP